MKKFFLMIMAMNIAMSNLYANPNSLGASSREMDITDVIWSPEGNEEYFLKSCNGYILTYLGVIEYEENEMLSSLIFSNDRKEVFFKDILSYGGIGSYVKGEVNDNIISLSLPQTVVYYSDGKYGLDLCVMKFSLDEEGKPLAEVQYDIDEVTFTINPSNGSISLNLPGESGEYILGYAYTNDSSWTGIGDFYQEYTTSANEFISMPDGVETTEYSYINDTYGYMVNVAIDEDYLYIQGLCEYLPDSVIRADYDQSNGIASIPQDQLLGIYSNMFTVVTKIVFQDEETELYSFAPETMTYNLLIDKENKIIKSISPEDGEPKPILCLNMDPEKVYGLQMFSDILLKHQDNFSGEPLNPYDLFYDESLLEYYGYTSFFFSVPFVSTKETLLDTNELYYRIYVDGELWEFEFDPDTYAYYGIEELTTEIPVLFSNDWDIINWSNTQREVGLYSEGFNSLGVQMVYKYGENITYSDLISLDISSGEITTKIDSIEKDAEIINCEYYNLQGRKVLNPDSGIFIKRITLSNGKVISFKIVIK